MSHAIHHHSTIRGATPRAATSLIARIGAAFAVWRQRRVLAELPEHLRRDVGLSVKDVHRESARPIWDIPGHWRV